VEFVVYFEWDRSDITDQAASVIQMAAQRAAECGVAAVTIEGHADRSGSATYNEGLSQRRAEAVRERLVQQGIAAGNITTEAFGETQPAVETPDGVREPLNRRSEVVIRVNGAAS
jgi:outer membrane protein OmpA-like peptidoglycan-associated protein